MKKIFLSLLIATFLLSCGNNKNENETTDEQSIKEESITEEVHPDDMPILLGKQEINAIKSPPYTKWFMENYRYSFNQKKMGPLKSALEGKTINIFMGTWCEDSRMQVPALLSILEAIKYDYSNVTLITVSEDKDTPEGLEEGFNIEYVPTIIIYNNNVEMGRIVEYPIESLEADLLKIASGEEYNHAYSDVE